jgi:uncharacterized protein YbbC (DUF1343 family)
MMQKTLTGLDVLISQGFDSLRGKRIGLVTHSAAVDSRFRNSVDLFHDARLDLLTVFGPEHGLHGQAQDLIGVSEEESKSTTQVVSLYGSTEASLHPTQEQLAGLDVLVIDMQDVGARFYTFQATMLYCMQVALPMGISVMVLDRPNPLGGQRIEGPTLCPGFHSFVGAYPLAVRHGMTMGELALMYRDQLQLGPGELTVVPCQGLRESDYFEATGAPWVLPSPNMPTVDTAVVYPGQCLFEGTNLSEGRGTTRPFEICGAPWIDAIRLAKEMNDQQIEGVIFRPVWFRPTFQKHAGQDCGGVQIHVIDRGIYQPVRASLALLIAMRAQNVERFAWRTEVYEFVKNPIAIDLLFGSSRERIAIENGVPWQTIAQEWEAEESAFQQLRKPYKYPHDFNSC